MIKEIKEEVPHITCKLCGKCCYFIVNGKKKKCKHLALHKNGKTACRIYRKRLGRVLFTHEHEGKKIQHVCMLRKESEYNYPDCPFNKEGKKMHPLYEVEK